MAIRINRLPAGFVIPAQPVLNLASKPPSGPDWVHEIKHDGYWMIVHRDGPAVRLYSRNAYDWTEAVVRGPDGLSRFDELSRS
jgi:ATP-dependent DNA ligase